MKKVSIGSRNQRISIEQDIGGFDELGAPQESWQEFAPAWAKVTNKSGSESDSGGRLHAAATYWFVIGWLADVNESMRIIWNGKTLNITNAHDPDGTSDVLKITAFVDDRS
ncbi:MAG: phage head closure protein [Bermanella sp.]|jgi:phage head-tail adaptor, putative, SPP1 family